MLYYKVAFYQGILFCMPTPLSSLSFHSPQGFTRPKVLVLLPTRNLAFKLVRRLVGLATREARTDSVQGKERFVEQFTDPEVSVGDRKEGGRAVDSLHPVG